MNTLNEIKCNNNFFQHLKDNLSKFEANSKDTKGAQKAAVAITIADLTKDSADGTNIFTNYSRNDASIIITTRAPKLKNHAGQWALPGGKIDAGETAVDTALRELSEEVDLTLQNNSVIGHLDDFVTRSGFAITPVVIWGGPELDLTPNLQEVNSIYRIPVAELLSKDAPVLEHISDSNNPILYMPIGISWVAAPTAALLYQFREVAILGNNVSVEHFEQPYFARK